MTVMTLWQAAALALALGLLAFVEPCSVGGHLLFIKSLPAGPKTHRLVPTLVFTLTRSALMAALGVAAALIGAAFSGLQAVLWAFLGLLYFGLGILYLAGGAGWMIRRIGGRLPLPENRAGNAAALGLLFGLNIPACAAPLLAVLLGQAAARVAAGQGVLFGAVTLFVFGLALSAPILLAAFTDAGGRLMTRIARISGRMPRLTGVVLMVLGSWSLYLAIQQAA